MRPRSAPPYRYRVPRCTRHWYCSEGRRTSSSDWRSSSSSRWSDPARRRCRWQEPPPVSPTPPPPLPPRPPSLPRRPPTLRISASKIYARPPPPSTGSRLRRPPVPQQPAWPSCGPFIIQRERSPQLQEVWLTVGKKPPDVGVPLGSASLALFRRRRTRRSEWGRVRKRATGPVTMLAGHGGRLPGDRLGRPSAEGADRLRHGIRTARVEDATTDMRFAPPDQRLAVRGVAPEPPRRRSGRRTSCSCPASGARRTIHLFPRRARPVGIVA